MGCTQISVNDMITVPEHKPDIESIRRISIRAIIDKTITTRKKIFFAGHVDICIEYVACTCDDTQPIHILHSEIEFKGLKLHRGARECYKSFLKAKVRFCESDIINPRKITVIIILHLCRLKFRRIGKRPNPQCLKPFHESVCKADSPHGVPIQDSFCEKPHDCDCTPAPHICDCKQQDSCDGQKPSCDHECKPPSCDYECKPKNSNQCKPPSHNLDCMPHYSGYCKPPTYDDYAYQSHPGSDSKQYEYVSSDDFHVPTYIQPCKKMGNSHGVTFGFTYEE